MGPVQKNQSTSVALTQQSYDTHESSEWAALKELLTR